MIFAILKLERLYISYKGLSIPKQGRHLFFMECCAEMRKGIDLLTTGRQTEMPCLKVPRGLKRG